MVKYARDGTLDRRILNRLFGQKNARPDAECWDLEAFIRNTMSGCGWDMKERQHFWEFCTTFGIQVAVSPQWRVWFEGSDPEDDKWAVIEKNGDDPARWAWFHKSMMVSEWSPMGDPSPITKKLVPFKNGYFKSVPIDDE